MGNTDLVVSQSDNSNTYNPQAVGESGVQICHIIILRISNSQQKNNETDKEIGKYGPFKGGKEFDRICQKKPRHLIVKNIISAVLNMLNEPRQRMKGNRENTE